jgi:(2Fe-2S) ferredoxin
VCTNLPCQLRDGNRTLEYMEHKLGVPMGGTTADGLFTLQQSECLGACADSPVLLVNDRHMCSFMSNDKLDQLIDGLRSAGGTVMNVNQLLQFQATGRGNLFPRPPHQSPDLCRPEWQQLVAQRLRGTRRLPGFAQNSGQGSAPTRAGMTQDEVIAR